MKKLADFIFEAAVVKRFQRTGWQILGDNVESVGEHSFMTAVIAYVLAKQTKSHGVNVEKILTMSIFHDFHEARTGDIDKIATFYVTRNQGKANEDIFSHVDNELLELLVEYETRASHEAKLVYEANIIALLVELKQVLEKGNTNAEEWIDANTKRLRLSESKRLARTLMDTNTQDWWKSIRIKLHASFAA